jgi:hypothetical protein
VEQPEPVDQLDRRLGVKVPETRLDLWRRC